MSYSAADNSIDVAYWFFDRAADNMKPLDDAKAQHLVFLSQLLYADAYDRAMLVPSVFVCSEEGIFEPNLKKYCRRDAHSCHGYVLTPKLTIFWKKSGKGTLITQPTIWQNLLKVLIYTKKITKRYKNYS